MDSIDRGILLDLGRNCRTTLKDLADRHDVTSNAIRKRIVSLEEKGVIRQYIVELSRAMVNSELMFALLYTDGSVDVDVFADRVFEHPLVIRVHYDSYGSCIVHAEYSGTEQMSELSSFFRRLESVEEVEIHTLPEPRGEIKPLTRIQLRVLAPLLDEPRMRVSDIAKKSNLTVRRVRRTLKELVESKSVLFTYLRVLTAADASYVAFRITWESKHISPEQVEKRLRERFPNEFWRVSYSAIEPIMWCGFLIENSTVSETIRAEFSNIPSVDVRNIILVYPPKKTRSIRHQALRKMIEDAGFL